MTWTRVLRKCMQAHQGVFPALMACNKASCLTRSCATEPRQTLGRPAAFPKRWGRAAPPAGTSCHCRAPGCRAAGGVPNTRLAGAAKSGKWLCRTGNTSAQEPQSGGTKQKEQPGTLKIGDGAVALFDGMCHAIVVVPQVLQGLAIEQPHIWQQQSDSLFLTFEKHGALVATASAARSGSLLFIYADTSPDRVCPFF